MKDDARTRAFEATFPWAGRFLRRDKDYYYDLEHSSVDADILDRMPGAGHSAYLISRSGDTITEVVPSKKWGFFRGLLKLREYAPGETVSGALERLGPAADEVAFILATGPAELDGMWHKYLKVYHTRSNTSIAKVWRRLAAQELERVKKELDDAMSAEAATATA